MGELLAEDKDKRPFLKYPLKETGFHKILVSVFGFLFKGIMKLDVSGSEFLPNNGAVIVAANHVTSMDVFPMQLALTRPIFFMGKAELFKNPVLHYAFRNLGAFPVFRGERDEWAMEHSKKILLAGQVLGMFPEGTRSRGRGLKVAKTGVARLSIDLGCPIVTMSIDGSHTFFKNFPRRNKIRIILGPPIYPLKGELPIGLTDRMMYQMADNLPGDLRGVYSS